MRGLLVVVRGLLICVRGLLVCVRGLLVCVKRLPECVREVLVCQSRNLKHESTANQEVWGKVWSVISYKASVGSKWSSRIILPMVIYLKIFYKNQ